MRRCDASSVRWLLGLLLVTSPLCSPHRLARRPAAAGSDGELRDHQPRGVEHPAPAERGSERSWEPAPARARQQRTWLLGSSLEGTPSADDLRGGATPVAAYPARTMTDALTPR